MTAPSLVVWTRHRPYAPALAGLLVTTFLVLCWHYASGLNLWGDEAYSLDFVEGRNLGTDPSHLPTYYALLKVLTSFVPGTNELALRMLHALAFALGLLFGAIAVWRLTRSAGTALVSLGVAVLLPEFQFYATNLRMYSLLFLATMAHLDAVSRLAEEEAMPSSRSLAWYVISGAALVAIDFPGLFYFAIGAAFLALRWRRVRRSMLMPVLILPLLPLLAFFFLNRSLVANLLRWIPARDRVGLSAGTFDILKWAYQSFRPGLDLIYAAPLPNSIALVLPAALFLVIVFGALRQVLGERGRTLADPLIPLLALSWILVVPTGVTYTRLFLPSQFFMIVVLVRAARSPAKALRVAANAAIAVLLLVNLHQSVNPTYRLDSIVPYRQIADDAAALCVAEGIATVMASDNSMNVESISRYMDRHAVNRPFRVLAANDAELAQYAGELRGEPFLFISHMGKNDAFTDVRQLTQRSAQLVRSYVPLRTLPYNDLWKRRYAEHARQPDAIEIWIVR